MNSLEVRNLKKSFGSFEVIRDLNLQVGRGERHALIGPNGAGKTTLFNLITGWDVPTAGEIWIEGIANGHHRPDALARCGMARSFQKNTLFESVTVFENLRVAAQAMHPSRRSIWAGHKRYADVMRQAESAGAQMQLEDVFDRKVNELSYGKKRQLEVAIALCSRPRILLMDEPAAGTSPTERAHLIALLQQLPRDLTMVLVEHDMDVVFAVCDVVTVLSYGRVLATGTPDAVKRDPSVIEAYLGQGHAGA
jgi:branched-chain amino acid transport system ATP-binding protein